jgi:hypothetical protein
MEGLPRLLPTTHSEVHAKFLAVCVESRNGYNLFWQILELTVPGFDPTISLEQPRLQAKRHVFHSSWHCMSIFLRVVASSEYADIVSNLQSNIDSYPHPDDENFLSQLFHLTNAAMQININAKAWVQDVGYPCINLIAGWDSIRSKFDMDELAFCHVQGYCPRVLCLEQGRDHGFRGHGPDCRGLERQLPNSA